MKFELFGLHIKQFLTASKIDFSDILETPPNIVYLKKNSIDVFVYEQFEMGTMTIFYSIQTDHGLCLSFPVRLPHSASVFNAEVWAGIKAFEQTP